MPTRSESSVTLIFRFASITSILIIIAIFPSFCNFCMPMLFPLLPLPAYYYLYVSYLIIFFSPHFPCRPLLPISSAYSPPVYRRPSAPNGKALRRQLPLPPLQIL